MLGHQFCDDFAGRNAFIPLNVSGTYTEINTETRSSILSDVYHFIKTFYYHDKFILTALVSSFLSGDQAHEIDETVYEGKFYYTKILLNYMVVT